MSSKPQPPPGANYPLRWPADDPRFTFGLLYDIREVLLRHGYPELRTADAMDLQATLFRFVYGDGENREPATPTPSGEYGRENPETGGPLPPGAVGYPLGGRKRPPTEPGEQR